MSKESSAHRYAKVLLDISKAAGIDEKAGDSLKELSSAFKSNESLYKTLLNPMYPLENRLNIVTEITKKIKADKSVTNLLSTLVENRKVRLIEHISDAYQSLLDINAGRLNVTVESATKLPDDAKKSITEKLKKETGKEIILTDSVNKDLIGGLVIRVGNTILDGSLKTQLKNINERLLEGAI